MNTQIYMYEKQKNYEPSQRDKDLMKNLLIVILIGIIIMLVTGL